MTESECPCCLGDPETVCDACGSHSCWAGVFVCEDAATAGSTQLDRVDNLLDHLRDERIGGASHVPIATVVARLAERVDRHVPVPAPDRRPVVAEARLLLATLDADAMVSTRHACVLRLRRALAVLDGGA